MTVTWDETLSPLGLKGETDRLAIAMPAQSRGTGLMEHASNEAPWALLYYWEQRVSQALVALSNTHTVSDLFQCLTLQVGQAFNRSLCRVLHYLPGEAPRRYAYDTTSGCVSETDPEDEDTEHPLLLQHPERDASAACDHRPTATPIDQYQDPAPTDDIPGMIRLPLQGPQGPVGMLMLRQDTIGPWAPHEQHFLDCVVGQFERTLRHMSAHQALTDWVYCRRSLLANFSHELRAPLTSIIGYAQILETDLERHLNPHQRRYFLNLQTSAQHLLNLMNDLLDFARLEAGKIKLTPEWISVRHFVQEARDIFQGLTIGATLNLQVITNPQVEGFEADPVRLRQILLNLLSNAIKFNRPGGSITLRLDMPEEEADWITVAVEDQGQGIPTDQLQYLFSDFFQVVGTSEARQGVGLGLSITRRLVESHGGSILVTSTPGQGSVFTLRWPQYSPIDPI